MVNAVGNFLIMLSNLHQMHLKLLQKEWLKMKVAEATGDLVGIKIADKITKISTYRSRTVSNETENIGLDREISKERHKSQEKRQQIIGDLRLI